jgi:hypothetical protein
MKSVDLQPSQKVRVVQTIRTREGQWPTQIEGEVVSCEQAPTGSWFAHGKNDKLWLQRLRLKRSDGELVDLVLDEATQITILGE